MKYHKIANRMNLCFVYRKLSFGKDMQDTGIGAYLKYLFDGTGSRANIYVITSQRYDVVTIPENVEVFSIPNTEFLVNHRVIFCLVNSFIVAITCVWIRIVRQVKFDIIEFPNWDVEGFFYVLLFRKFFPKTHVITRLHTPFLVAVRIGNLQASAFGARILNYFERVQCILSNRVITSTKPNRDISSKCYGIGVRRIDIVPIGVPIPKQVRNSMQINNSILNILFVGRLEARKGVDILFKAIPVIFKRCPKISLYIVGRGGDHIISSIFSMGLGLDILSRIHCMSYVSDKKLMDELYSVCNLCIFPSRYESFGLVIAEAMSRGKVVISSKVGGITSLISDLNNGILIPPGNHKALADSVAICYKDIKLMNRLGMAAREKAIRSFSHLHTSEIALDYYSSVIKEIN